MKWALLVIGLLLVTPVQAQRVYDENTDRLPPGCQEISQELAWDVRGGREHAADFDGRTFMFDVRSFDAPSCARVHVTFTNDDDSRHMWMVHGVYPNGTFLLEADGGQSASGTFITPAEQETLLVHCGIPTHQQQGMKAQILVNGGEGDLPNIPGISGLPEGDQEAPMPLLAGLCALALWAWRHRREP